MQTYLKPLLFALLRHIFIITILVSAGQLLDCHIAIFDAHFEKWNRGQGKEFKKKMVQMKHTRTLKSLWRISAKFTGNSPGGRPAALLCPGWGDKESLQLLDKTCPVVNSALTSWLFSKNLFIPHSATGRYRNRLSGRCNQICTEAIHCIHVCSE